MVLPTIIRNTQHGRLQHPPWMRDSNDNVFIENQYCPTYWKKYFFVNMFFSPGLLIPLKYPAMRYSRATLASARLSLITFSTGRTAVSPRWLPGPTTQGSVRKWFTTSPLRPWQIMKINSISILGTSEWARVGLRIQSEIACGQLEQYSRQVSREHQSPNKRPAVFAAARYKHSREWRFRVSFLRFQLISSI